MCIANPIWRALLAHWVVTAAIFSPAQCRKKQSRQNGDNGDDHQQLNQSEAPATFRKFHVLHASRLTIESKKLFEQINELFLSRNEAMKKFHLLEKQSDGSRIGFSFKPPMNTDA